MLGKHINHCEDSLTASVFGHLLHLPLEMFWNILRGACYTEKLPAHPGEPELEPWPSWNARGTDNSYRVIPDLHLRFADFDLIVEAKRWNEGMQDRGQWQNQLIAYANEYGNLRRPVRMIALGGIHGNADEEIRHQWMPDQAAADADGGKEHEFVCPVHMCRWSGLLAECQRARKALASGPYISSQSRAHERLLDDLIDLFSWHGFQTGSWFSELVPKLSPSGIRAASEFDIFRNISKRFFLQ